MNLAPFLNAPLVIQLHALAALGAILIGSVQLIGLKGTTTHKVLGYTWVFLMLTIAVSSFWIREIQQWHGFSWIHLLSVLTLVAVPLAVHAARHGNIKRHRTAMTTIFWMALILTGVFTLLPGRILHRVFFGS